MKDSDEFLAKESEKVMAFLLDVPALKSVKKKTNNNNNKRRNSLVPMSENSESPISPRQTCLYFKTSWTNVSENKPRRQSYT